MFATVALADWVSFESVARLTYVRESAVLNRYHEPATFIMIYRLRSDHTVWPCKVDRAPTQTPQALRDWAPHHLVGVIINCDGYRISAYSVGVDTGCNRDLELLLGRQ